jgi:hypothetical protein
MQEASLCTIETKSWPSKSSPCAQGRLFNLLCGMCGRVCHKGDLCRAIGSLRNTNPPPRRAVEQGLTNGRNPTKFLIKPMIVLEGEVSLRVGIHPNKQVHETSHPFRTDAATHVA